MGNGRRTARTYAFVQEPIPDRLATGSRPYQIPQLEEDDRDPEPPRRVVRAITSEDATSVSGELHGYQILDII